MVPSSPLTTATRLALAIGPVAAASVIGSLATLPNVPGWYQGLTRPWFTPPNGAFGPAWTILYILMAYAFYRVLQKPGPAGSRRWPITAFLVQITLNAGWSVAFFGAQSPFLGLAVIVPLWLSIAWALFLFWRRDPIAGACFVPYLAWVTFAAVLNYEIWRLNP